LDGIVAERTTDLTEANEELQRFAYIVSHDLRSPLVNIMGFTSELEGLRGDIFEEYAEPGHQVSKPIGAGVRTFLGNERGQMVRLLVSRFDMHGETPHDP
jgi:light-regulated signal transduction histidine kinase (bacteriophytochrome)